MNETNNTKSEDHFEEVDLWLRVLHVLILLLLLIASIVGNSLVLLLVIFNRSLQYRSVISSLGLVAADMIIATSWSITGIGSAIAGECPFGQAGCSILGAVLSVAIYARWCTVALITFERFCSIVFPFFYLKWSKYLLIVLVILSWLIPVATIFPWLGGVGTYVYRLRFAACTIFCADDRACFQFYITLYGLFLAIGGIMPTILYFSMCIIGQRKHYKMKHIAMGTHRTQTADLESGQSSNESNCTGTTQLKCNDSPGPDISVQESSTRNSISSKSRSDSESLGNSSGLKKKILTTFFLIFINVLLTQLPLYISSSLRSQEHIYNKIPLFLNFTFVYIYLLGSVLDPLLIIRNRDFRDIITKALRRRSSTQSASVRGVLFDFAKMSTLLEMAPNTTGRRNLRRYSCPSTAIQKRAAMEPAIITKARSYDGYVNDGKDKRLSMTLPSMILTEHFSTQDVEKEEERQTEEEGEKRTPATKLPLDGVDER